MRVQIILDISIHGGVKTHFPYPAANITSFNVNCKKFNNIFFQKVPFYAKLTAIHVKLSSFLHIFNDLPRFFVPRIPS